MEQSLEKCATHEAIQPLIQYLPVLKRAEKLRIDLEYYLGKQWEEKYPPTAAVREYCQHLEQLETTVGTRHISSSFLTRVETIPARSLLFPFVSCDFSWRSND